MPSPTHSFLFDVNFNVGTESVYTQINSNEGAPFPPSEGVLLLTDLTDFLLTDLEPLALA